MKKTSNPVVDQLNCGVADMNINSKQDSGWEVYVKKSYNKSGNSGSKQQMLHCSAAKVRGSSGNNRTSYPRSPAGRGKGRPNTVNQVFKNTPLVQPSPKNGFNWATIVASAHSAECPVPEEEEDEDEESRLPDTDDEFLSDEFDSDSSEKSHETHKKNRWFKEFFNCINSLTTEQINDPGRQWHCPACKGGPGGIDWFRGLYPLTMHAKTRKSKRVKLHRELAKLLEVELSRRGTSVVQAGEIFRKWNGLEDEEKDFEIVWPPMVIIANARYEKDENERWVGMGNQELLNYFSSYAPVRARHSYGPQGHRGISILIFDDTPVGYLEAEQLSKHFTDTARDRDAWERKHATFQPGGKRQLFGFMAENRDIDYFNQHSHGKSRLKFDIRSHKQMVVEKIKKMGADNEQLLLFKDKAAKHQMQVKVLEESVSFAGEKLHRTVEEYKLIRLRTKMHHEETKEEMDSQNQFYKDQMKMIYDNRNAKEESFEKMQQEHFDKVKQSYPNTSPIEDHQERMEEIAKCYEMEEFIAERERLIKGHEERKTAMRRRHREEEIALEKELDAKLAMLMEKYTPSPPSNQT